MTPEAINPPIILAERERPFWGFAEVLLIAAVFLPAILIAGLGMESLAADIGLDPKSGFVLVIAQFVGYGIVLLLMKMLFARYHKPLLESLAWIPSPFKPVYLITTGFTLAFAMVLLGTLLQTPDIQTPFEKLLDDRLSRIVIAFFGVTLGPVVEELLFRGFLQPVLIDSLGALPGIAITAVLFGSMHLVQNANIWQSGLLIAVVGFVLGVIRHISGSTKASAITHVSYNALPFLALLISPDQH